MSATALAWAYRLTGVTPLEKLLAIYIGDHAGPADADGSEAVGLDIAKAAEWCGCSEHEALVALSALGRLHGLACENVLPDGRFFITFEPIPVRLVNVSTAETHSLWIYVATTVQGVKIGISRDVDKRLRGLETGSPLEVKLAFSASGPWSVIRRIEKECHQELAAHNIVGEWFSCPPDVAVSVVKVALFKAGITK